MGIPFRITVGKKLANGMVELVPRRDKQVRDVRVEEVASMVAGLIRQSPNGK